MIARPAWFLGLLLCVIAMATVLYLQFYHGLQPCALCVLQRIAVVLMGVFFLIGLIHNPKSGGRNLYGILLFLSTFLGLYAAGRQVYLQHFPEHAGVCGANFNFVWTQIPSSGTLATLFKGTGDCAVIHMHFLTLTLPEWSLIMFVGFLIFNIVMTKKRANKNAKK
jgi:disulfide bond formation protein DsbB